MTAGELFRLVIILAAFYPLIKQKTLEMARIEPRRNSRGILLGLPIFRYIDINDSEEVILASRQIARALSKH
jgi:hypothetical protein